MVGLWRFQRQEAEYQGLVCLIVFPCCQEAVLSFGHSFPLLRSMMAPLMQLSLTVLPGRAL